MNKAIIFAIVAAAFSNTAFAADPVTPTAKFEKQCPAGTKLVRRSEITILKDGSGSLVEVEPSCEPLEQPAEGFRVETPGDGYQ